MNTESELVPTPTTPSQPAPVTPEREPLSLPKGALFAFRSRDATRTRELVIYPDGRVSLGGPDLSKEAYARAPRLLNDAQIARLRKTLERANVSRLASVEGELPAEVRVYEIAARLGNRVWRIVVREDAVPDALVPLIQQVSALIPKE